MLGLPIGWLGLPALASVGANSGTHVVGSAPVLVRGKGHYFHSSKRSRAKPPPKGAVTGGGTWGSGPLGARKNPPGFTNGRHSSASTRSSATARATTTSNAYAPSPHFNPTGARKHAASPVPRVPPEPRAPVSPPETSRGMTWAMEVGKLDPDSAAPVHLRILCSNVCRFCVLMLAKFVF